MNTDNEDYKLIKINETIIDCVENGDYSNLAAEIAISTIPQFVQALANSLGRLSEASIDALKTCFVTAIMAQEHEDMRHYDNETRMINKYNDQVDKIIDKLDIKDAQTVENCIRIINELRKALIDYCNSNTYYKKSFFQRLFGRK